MNPTIREERLEDVAAIHQLTELAFSTMPYSSGTEHLIIDALRAEGALVVSLVAIAEDVVVGHIAFSLVSLSSGDQGWYALGPVSVEPRFQRKGIGSALIREGLKRLEEAGACGCVLVGHRVVPPGLLAFLGDRKRATASGTAAIT